MNPTQIEVLRRFKHDITRFMMAYKFALDEMETKLEILQEEFQLLHDYNPIEHTKSRLKSPESIMKKLYKKNYELTLTSIKENIQDIAGVRITCSFISDIYMLAEMLKKQSDLHVLQVKDYITNPKPNGYRSLHLLVEIPVHMSDRQEQVCIEIQIRTIAMDFWASLEHKIFYKYNQAIPERLINELKSAADSATALDMQMERLHREITVIKENQADDLSEQFMQLKIGSQQFQLPEALFRLIEEM